MPGTPRARDRGALSGGYLRAFLINTAATEIWKTATNAKAKAARYGPPSGPGDPGWANSRTAAVEDPTATTDDTPVAIGPKCCHCRTSPRPTRNSVPTKAEAVAIRTADTCVGGPANPPIIAKIATSATRPKIVQPSTTAGSELDRPLRWWRVPTWP